MGHDVEVEHWLRLHALTSHSVFPAGTWTVRKTWWSVTSRRIWPSETKTSRQPLACGQKEALASPVYGERRRKHVFGHRPAGGGALFPRRQRVPRLTLPDPPSIDVDLHGESRVKWLVVVQDKDVAAKGVDAGGVHRCILGNGVGQQGSVRLDHITTGTKVFKIERRKRRSRRKKEEKQEWKEKKEEKK